MTKTLCRIEAIVTLLAISGLCRIYFDFDNIPPLTNIRQIFTEIMRMHFTAPARNIVIVYTAQKFAFNFAFIFEWSSERLRPQSMGGFKNKSKCNRWIYYYEASRLILGVFRFINYGIRIPHRYAKLQPRLKFDWGWFRLWSVSTFWRSAMAHGHHIQCICVRATAGM